MTVQLHKLKCPYKVITSEVEYLEIVGYNARKVYKKTGNYLDRLGFRLSRKTINGWAHSLTLDEHSKQICNLKIWFENRCDHYNKLPKAIWTHGKCYLQKAVCFLNQYASINPIFPRL